MSERLYYLVYISKAKELIQEDELVFLLDQSKRNNDIKQITGMLLYMEGSFLDSFKGRFIQVLEGEKENVDYVFNIIKSDDRHLAVVVLSEGILKERYFKTWSMGFRSLSENSKHSNYVSPDKFFQSVPSTGDDETLAFLRSFYAMNA